MRVTDDRPFSLPSRPYVHNLFFLSFPSFSMFILFGVGAAPDYIPVMISGLRRIGQIASVEIQQRRRRHYVWGIQGCRNLWPFAKLIKKLRLLLCQTQIKTGRHILAYIYIYIYFLKRLLPLFLNYNSIPGLLPSPKVTYASPPKPKEILVRFAQRKEITWAVYLILSLDHVSLRTWTMGDSAPPPYTPDVTPLSPSIQPLPRPHAVVL